MNGITTDTPLLKHRIITLLQTANATGHIANGIDSVSLSHDSKATVGNVNRALWSLQKQGLVTFRERKNGNANGESHASAAILTHFRLTEAGRAWTFESTALMDVVAVQSSGEYDPATVERWDTEDVAKDVQRAGMRHRVDKAIDMIRDHKPAPCSCDHPAGTVLKSVSHDVGCPWATQQEALAKAVRRIDGRALARGEADPVEVASAVIAEGDRAIPPFVLDPRMTASDALFALLKHEGSVHIKPEANALLGYSEGSTAIYSLVKANPEGFVIGAGNVTLRDDRPAGWRPRPSSGGRKRGPMSSPILDEARASVALDGETQSVDGVAGMTPNGVIPPGTFHMPQLGPEIRALMERAGKREKVAEAVAALEAIGMDEDALTLMTRIPDDTPLEVEVLTLIRALEGYNG